MDLLDGQRADELGTLLALAETGSFAAAGRIQNRHPSVLSRRLNALERRLGVRLVERTTRHFRLTNEGEKLVGKVRQAANLLAEAQQEASAGAVEIGGSLRISLPATMGRQRLSATVAEFSLAHPAVTVDVEYTDRMVDIIGERFDAAIRIGELADSRLVAMRLCDYRRILGASKTYLNRCGVPQEPADLINHNCLGFTGLASHPEWNLVHMASQSKEPSAVIVTVKGTLLSNDNDALLTAALMGVGVVAGGDWLLDPLIASGALVRVLPSWQLGASGGIYFLRPSAQFSTAAMTAFRQWIAERLPHPT